MKHLLTISTLIMVLLFTSCSSKDEPEPEYTGPWKIEYAEQYAGWHTRDPKFKEWFNSHVNDFEAAGFSDFYNTQVVSYTKEAGDWIEWGDYKTWYKGFIEWSEVIEYSTESEIEYMIANFENFSSEDGNGQYDNFYARYRKQPQTE